MRRWLTALVLALALATLAYVILGGDGPRRSAPLSEPEGAPSPTIARSEPPMPAPAATGSLVVRLHLPDGARLPAGAEAGYLHFGRKRLRSPGADGTFRFSDVPVGVVTVLAEVAGYESDPATVVLVPGMPAEALLLLHAAPPPGR